VLGIFLGRRRGQRRHRRQSNRAGDHERSSNDSRQTQPCWAGNCAGISQN
jgi:hypothetical protein